MNHSPLAGSLERTPDRRPTARPRTVQLVSCLAVALAALVAVRPDSAEARLATQASESGKGGRAEKPPAVSSKLQKPLKAAQDALNEKKWQDAVAKLKEADAMDGKSPYEQYLIDELSGFAYVRLGDYPEAAKYLEASFKSPYFDKSQQASRLNALAQIYYQTKNYDKAIEYGTQAIQGGTGDAQMPTLVAQSYYIKGDYKGTLGFLNGVIADLDKRGQAAPEQTLQLLLSSCVKLQDDACTMDALAKLVAVAPKTEYWQSIVTLLLRDQGKNEKSLLQVYRLAAAVDTMRRPDEYREMAELAIGQGLPGEAQRILEKGFANNVFADATAKATAQKQLDQAKKLAASDLASLPKLEADVKASKTGDKDIGLALAFYSYQQYPKAVEAFARGLQKGGVRNEADARLMLGISQLMANDKDAALQTFKQVQGDPKLARIASLWSVHAQKS